MLKSENKKKKYNSLAKRSLCLDDANLFNTLYKADWLILH